MIKVIIIDIPKQNKPKAIYFLDIDPYIYDIISYLDIRNDLSLLISPSNEFNFSIG